MTQNTLLRKSFHHDSTGMFSMTSTFSAFSRSLDLAPVITGWDCGISFSFLLRWNVCRIMMVAGVFVNWCNVIRMRIYVHRGTCSHKKSFVTRAKKTRTFEGKSKTKRLGMWALKQVQIASSSVLTVLQNWNFAQQTRKTEPRTAREKDENKSWKWKIMQALFTALFGRFNWAVKRCEDVLKRDVFTHPKRRSNPLVPQ